MELPFLCSQLLEEEIESYIGGKQNFRKGQKIVACGDVQKVSFSTISSENYCCSAFVHAEMISNMNYLVRVFLSTSSILQSECVCKAGKNRHNKCKHVAAVLLSLFCLQNHKSDPPNWITTRRQYVTRFADPGTDLYKQIRGGLTYTEILNRFSLEVERHNGKLPKLQRHPCLPKFQKKKPKGDPPQRLELACDVIDPEHELHSSQKKISEPIPPGRSGSLSGVSAGVKCDSREDHEESGKEKGGKNGEKKEKKKEVKRKRSITQEEESFYRPTKRNRSPVEYPPELAGASESKREEYRLKRLYEMHSQNKHV